MLPDVISDCTDFRSFDRPELSLSSVFTLARGTSLAAGLRPSRCPPHKSILPERLAGVGSRSWRLPRLLLQDYTWE